MSPDEHWFVFAQVPPLAMRPHEPLTQVFGFVQSAVVVHVFTHINAVVSQRPGAQPTVDGVTQAPLPSHFD